MLSKVHDWLKQTPQSAFARIAIAGIALFLLALSLPVILSVSSINALTRTRYSTEQVVTAIRLTSSKSRTIYDTVLTARYPKRILKGNGARVDVTVDRSQVSNGKLGAKLSGQDLDADPSDVQLRTFAKTQSNVARWSWIIRPKEAGSHYLRIVFNADSAARSIFYVLPDGDDPLFLRFTVVNESGLSPQVEVWLKWGSAVIAFLASLPLLAKTLERSKAASPEPSDTRSPTDTRKQPETDNQTDGGRKPREHPETDHQPDSGRKPPRGGRKGKP